MNKYNIRVCSCGRVHPVLWSDLEETFDNEEELILICRNCGSANRFGADSFTDKEGRKNFSMYTIELPRDDSISIKSFDQEVSNKKLSQILLSPGVKIPMMTGNYANYFSEISRRFEDLSGADTKMNPEEIGRYSLEYDKINLDRLQKEVEGKDYAEELMEVIK